MKINKFDVVELNDKNKATILDMQNNNMYLVEIVNDDGISLGTRTIEYQDISKVIFKKNNTMS